MKHLVFLLAFIATAVTAGAQLPRGNYGTMQPITRSTGTIYKYTAGTPTVASTDTLTDVDTGLVRWTFSNGYNLLFDYTVTKLTGTVAGTALLQGSQDGTNWFTITGNTTYCAGCTGASATVTNTAGSKKYEWYVPVNATNFKYWQVQTITSGTMTATYSGNAYYSY